MYLFSLKLLVIHESAREKARMESRHMDPLSMIRIMRGRVMGVGETTQD